VKFAKKNFAHTGIYTHRHINSNLLLYVGEQIGLMPGITYTVPDCVTFGILWEKPKDLYAWAYPVSQNVDEVSVLAFPGDWPYASQETQRGYHSLFSVSRAISLL
jgi:hypothetical protein